MCMIEIFKYLLFDLALMNELMCYSLIILCNYFNLKRYNILFE